MNNHPSHWLSRLSVMSIVIIALAILFGFFIGMYISSGSPPTKQSEIVVPVGLPLDPPLEGTDFGFPPENVKALVARGIRSVAVLDETDTIRGIASLHEDGTCQTCKYIGNQPDGGNKDYPQGSVLQQGLNDMMPIGSVCAAGTCPNRRCGCSSGRCRKPGGHCCNC